eukprot:gene5266-7317_t
MAPSRKLIITSHKAKITPKEGESMDQYRKAVLEVLKSSETRTDGKLGGRELLEIIVKKWGVAYDLQLRKSAPFEYLEHLEAIARYITAMDLVSHFKEKVNESRKRPNSYFGYAVSIPLDIDPSSADSFFKDLPYE